MMSKKNFTLYINDDMKFVDLSLYQCGYEKCTPGHSFGPNIRHFYLIHFIIEGSGVYFIDNKEFTVSKNMCFMIPPGIETTYIADKDEPWEYYWIGIHGIKAKDILNQADLSLRHPVITMKGYQKIFSLLEPLILCEKRKEESKYFLRGYLYQIIGILVQDNEKLIVSKVSQNDDLVKLFIRYIEEEYTSKIKVSYFADKNSIERTNFSKIFKKHMDITPQNFIINFRLSKALVLLKNINLTTLEVSSLVGFSDYKHFLKSFKKKYGVTPKEYKKDPFETS